MGQAKKIRILKHSGNVPIVNGKVKIEFSVYDTDLSYTHIVLFFFNSVQYSCLYAI